MKQSETPDYDLFSNILLVHHKKAYVLPFFVPAV